MIVINLGKIELLFDIHSQYGDYFSRKNRRLLEKGLFAGLRSRMEIDPTPTPNPA